MDNLANRILRGINTCLIAGRPLPRECSMTWFPGRLLVRTDDGHTIEITARQLAPHDPDAQQLGETLQAIDAGDAE